MNKPNFAYDVEVFPNFFSCVFINVNDYINKCKEANIDNLSVSKKLEIYRSVEKYCFYLHDDNDKYLLPFLSFINRDIHLWGYNNLGYDKYILIALILGCNRFKGKHLLKHLHDISKIVIDIQRERDKQTKLGKRGRNIISIKNHPKTNHLGYYQPIWEDIDVSKIFALDKAKKSAKQVSINLGWYNILDYVAPPITRGIDDIYYPAEDLEILNANIEKWDRYIHESQINEVLKYDINDTFIVAEAIRKQIEEINLRFDISKEFDVYVKSDSRSKIADKLIEKFYENETGIPRHIFNRYRTKRDFIDVKECIWEGIKFNSTILDEVLKFFQNRIITSTRGEIKHEVTFNNTTYTIGAGGLHSKDGPGVFKSTNKVIIRDADVTSYYPFIILNFGICPAHLDETAWYNIMKFIIYRRVEAKEKGLTAIADALKIVVNSGGFGKMGFEDSFMYDEKAMVTVTITGQLLLLMLIEDLELNGIHCISANTDGIVCEIPVDLEDKYYEICNKWCDITKFKLEYTDYETYIRRDVNCYISVKKGSTKPKRKGALNYLNPIMAYTSGYDKPIVALAIENYFLKNIPVMDTLKDSKDILQFCASQKVNNKFDVFYTESTKDGIVEYNIEKHVRYYVSNSGGIIRKRDGSDISNGYKSLCAGQNTKLLNLLDDRDIKEYDINYGYYYRAAMDIIRQIETGTKDKSKIKKTYGMMGGLFDD